MVITHCSLLLLSIISVKGISGQYYSQLNPNSRYYGGKYNNNYNYGNLNSNIMRYPEVAVRPGELLMEANGPAAQTPCRNKEANKEHKDSLWWTLPIPPMEIEGSLPERPQVKQPEPVQQVEQAKPQQQQQMNNGGETGAMQQQKQHNNQAAPQTSTAKAQAQAQAAPMAAPVTPQAVAQVATTAKHEAATSAPSKQDRTKLAQMQKQQQQQQQQQQAVAQAQAQPGQTQQNAPPAPSQLVVSNKDNANQQQMITNKSVATVRGPAGGKPAAPATQHGSNKQKAMLNMMEPVGYPYPEEAMLVPQGGYMNNPYFNSPYLREPQLVSNQGYRGNMMNSMAELADNMCKNFDTNDAELGGGGLVGDNSSPYLIKPAPHPNLIQYDNFAPLEQQQGPNQWTYLTEDDRNKRNPLDSNYRQQVAIS